MQPPFLPGGESGVLPFAKFPHPQGLQHLAVRRGVVPPGEQLHRLHGADMGRQRGGLQLDAHPAPHLHPAAVRTAQPLHTLQGGGLARAVHPQQGKYLTPGHLKIQPFQHKVLPIALFEPLYLYRTVHWRSSLKGSMPWF